MLHPQLEQVLVGRADLRTGRQLQQLHDPVPVQVRTDLLDLLLLGEGVDPGLQLVVGAGQGAGLAPVAGGDVGAGEAVEVLDQVPGVGDVPAHGGVGPGRVDVAVEAQVQLHQAGHLLGGVLVEGQRPHPLGGQLRADGLVEAEGDHTAGLEAAGGGLAHVVHQCGQAQHQVGPLAGPVGAGRALQVDRLVEHRQGVLVDVLVVMVLVPLQLQGGQLRQHMGGQPQLGHQLQAAAGVGAQQELHQLLPDPFGGDDGDALGELLDRVGRAVLDPEPELGDEAHRPHHPQRVVGEGLPRADGGAQHRAGQVREPVEGIDQLQGGQPHRHRVDGEVAAGEVADQGVPVGDLGFAAVRVVGLGAIGGDLDLHPVAHPAEGAEVAAHVPDRAAGRPLLEDRLGVVGAGGGGEVQIGAGASQHRVPHRAAHQRELVPGGLEQPAQLVDLLGQRPEHGGRSGAGGLETHGGLVDGIGHGRSCPGGAGRARAPSRGGSRAPWAPLR